MFIFAHCFEFSNCKVIILFGIILNKLISFEFLPSVFQEKTYKYKDCRQDDHYQECRSDDRYIQRDHQYLNEQQNKNGCVFLSRIINERLRITNYHEYPYKIEMIMGICSPIKLETRCKLIIADGFENY